MLKLNKLMLRRERETMWHHKFTWKISEEIKNHDLPPIEKLHYEESKLSTRIYLAQANQSFPDHLTSTFTFNFSPSYFGAHLEFAPSSISVSSWIVTRRKWVFTQNQENEIWMFQKSTHYHFQKIHFKKNFLENLDGIFLEQATSKRKENEENKNDCCSFSSSRNGRKFDFKWE